MVQLPLQLCNIIFPARHFPEASFSSVVGGRVFQAQVGKVCPKALQCPARPLCGVMNPAVCFLASQGPEPCPRAVCSAFLSVQGGARGKHRLLCVEWSVVSWHLHCTYRWSSRCYCVAGPPCTPSQLTLTNDPVKEMGQGYFLHLTDAEW